MRISVITVCFNAAENLEKTIKSVISQTYEDIEYIIVDGGSTDTSLKILNRYNDHIDLIITEKDEGIYDAMNKGVSVSTGEFVIFMNAGDVFFDANAIMDLYLYSNNANADIIYGDHITDLNDKQYRSFAKPLNKIKYGMIFNHQSCMVKKTILTSHPFKTSILSADYDFFYNAYLNKMVFLYVNRPIAIYDAFGLSSKNKGKIYKEWMRTSLTNKFNIFSFFFFIVLNLKTMLLDFIRFNK
ncbi:glycosyltransferase family 2 protein [Edwardsiella tarda]